MQLLHSKTLIASSTVRLNVSIMCHFLKRVLLRVVWYEYRGLLRRHEGCVVDSLCSTSEIHKGFVGIQLARVVLEIRVDESLVFRFNYRG